MTGCSGPFIECLMQDCYNAKKTHEENTVRDNTPDSVTIVTPVM